MGKQKGGFDAAEVKVSNRQRGRFQEAFTLVELLVVISIIAILLSMLMPSLQRSRKQARTVICLSNLKQWGLMYEMYCNDNNGYFFSGQINGLDTNTDHGRYWRALMKPYSRNVKMWLCPEAVKPPVGGGEPKVGALPDVAWEYTGLNDSGVTESDIGSYGLNGWVLNPIARWTDIFGRTPVSDSWRTCQNKGSTNNIPVFADMWFTDVWPKDADPPSLTEKCPGDPETFTKNEMQRACVNRHNGSIDTVFMDWSARKVGLKELWTLKWHRSYNVGGRWTQAGHMRPENWPEWMKKFRDY